MSKDNKEHSPAPRPTVSNDNSLLSAYRPQATSFDQIDDVIAAFREPEFLALSLRKRFKTINKTLCKLILSAPQHAFLLRATLDFICRVNQENVLKEEFDLATFEFWLNHYSDFSDKDNYEIRAKIVGKHLSREEYQVFFPIGMDKTYFGTHFVTAHLSPDVDTMIASFSGWLDAFGARVGSGLHQWCLPGGPPDSPITSYLRELFGASIFSSVARMTPTITLSAMDLVTQKLLAKEMGETLISSLDHGPNGKAILLVNEKGHYLGDWRSSDVEMVRQITLLFKSCLHWFENFLHTHLIALFAKTEFTHDELMQSTSSLFDVKIKDCEPARDFNEKQRNHLNDFFFKVLGIENGFEGTFRDLSLALDQRGIKGMFAFLCETEKLYTLFDKKGKLKDDRTQIFNYLQELFNRLDKAMMEVRNFAERLDVVIRIKYSVLGIPPIYVTLQSDVTEIREKMKGHDFLAVVIHEQDGSLFPVGILRASDLREQGLGTVSMRDFCNLEEVRMASYLDVISIVDHHKSSLKTLSVPTALIGDAQSCNVLIAEQTFLLNDRYSLGGLTSEQIVEQIKEVSSQLNSAAAGRILQRLLRRQEAVRRGNTFFIHPGREYAEYLCFLQAILDDTDLLTKVSNRDVECVAQLLNRLKSLSVGQEVEIIHFDDIVKDKNFAKAAAKRILQQADMYSLYKHIYSLRESDVEAHLELCAQGRSSNIFLDTKEQNGCARVGQTKLFSSNFPLFFKNASQIRKIWLKQSQEACQDKPEIDLHIHMISTIASAEEVHNNQIGPYNHQDELWFWCSPTQCGWRHLNSFLAGFQYAAKDFKNGMSIEYLGAVSDEFKNLFETHFPDVPKTTTESNLTMGIIRFKAGAVNSRKSMITPFIPRIV